MNNQWIKENAPVLVLIGLAAIIAVCISISEAHTECTNPECQYHNVK